MTQPTQPQSAFGFPAKRASLAWSDANGNSHYLFFDCVVDETWPEDAEITEHPVEQGADVADHVRVKLRMCELKVHATNEPIDANNWDQATITSSTLSLPGQTARVASTGSVTIPTWDNPIRERSILGSLAGIAGGLIGGAAGGARTGQIAGDITALVGLEAAFLLIPATEGQTNVNTDAGLGQTGGRTVQVQTQQWPAGTSGTDYVAKMISALQQLKNTAQQLVVFGSKSFATPMCIERLVHSRSSDTGTGASITIGLKEVRVVTTQTVPVPVPQLSAGGGVPPQNKGPQDPSVATQSDHDLFLELARKYAPTWAARLGG